MSERTRNLRKIIADHDTIVWENVVSLLLDEIESQHNMIEDLIRVNDAHYRRLDEGLMRLGKEIDRLKGVHGA